MIHQHRLVEVNVEMCKRLAQLLRSKSVPMDQEETDLPDLSCREIGNFYFWLVAICHQTSPRGKPPLVGEVEGRRRKGWDYLVARFEQAVRDNRDLLKPEQWMHMNGQQFSALFADPEAGERITDPEGRAALIRDLGEEMRKNEWTWIEEIYELCGRRVATGTPHLLSALAEWKAYRDPIRKKSLLFLAIMHNTGLWHYPDAQLLGSPVDYHEVRGHLRIGTVTVLNSDLKHKLYRALPVTSEEDLAIRGAVYDAIMLLSELTGLHNPSQLHYLFWNVLRSCCTHENPHCHGCPPSCPLPTRYVPLALHPDGRRCPFSEVCSSANVQQRYYEHVFDTDYY